MAKNKSVFGIYSSRSGVENAVTALKDSGFQHSDVSVLLPENLGNREIATEKNSKAPEGAATGAGSGAVIGGTLGWLVGIGALAIPGLGPFIAAGPIMAALAGMGVGGAVGGLVGALVEMGIPEYEAKRYDGRVRQGGILVSRPLRQLGMDRAREGYSEADRSRGCCLRRRGRLRLRENRQAAFPGPSLRDCFRPETR